MLNVNGASVDTLLITGVSTTVERLDDHVHKANQVLPTLAAGVTVSSCVAAWTLGPKQNIGSSVIASEFDYHFLNVEFASDVDTHEFHIFKGATTGSGTVIAKTRVTITAAIDKKDDVSITTPILAAAQKTFMRMANLTAAASSATISLNYHTY